MKKYIIVPLIISVFSVNSISVSAKSEKYTYCVRETLSVLDAGKEFVETLDIFNFWYESLSSVVSCVDSSLKDMEDRDKQYQEKINAITAMYLDMNSYLKQQEVVAAKLYQYKFIKSNMATSMAKSRELYLVSTASKALSFTKIGGNDLSLKNTVTTNSRKVALQVVRIAASSRDNLNWFDWKQRNPTLKELQELERFLIKTKWNVYWLNQTGKYKVNSSTDLLQKVQKKIAEVSKKK